jgi:hypothetical protein
MALLRRDDGFEQDERAIQEHRRQARERVERAAESRSDADTAEAAATESIAVRQAAGELSDADADLELEAAIESARRLRVHAQAQTRAAEEHERRAEQLEATLARRRYDVALAAVGDAHAAVVKESDGVAKPIGAIAARIEKLRAARTARDELVAEARRLQPLGAPDVVLGDEPEWPDLAAVVALLEEGPVQPVTDAERAAASAHREQERSAKDTIRTYVAQFGSRVGLSDEALAREVRLDEPLRARVIDAIRAEWQSRLDKLPPDRRAELERKRAELDEQRTSDVFAEV